jgi:hypothetical protein
VMSVQYETTIAAAETSEAMAMVSGEEKRVSRRFECAEGS